MSDSGPPPLPVSVPARPTGGQIAWRIFAAFAIAEAFAVAVRFVWGVGLLVSACAASSSGQPGPGRGDVLLAWISPFVVIAGVAAFSKARGWKHVAIGLWISVGLGLLSTGVVAAGVLG